MDVIQSIRERRSINFFDPSKRLPDELLHELLALANLAPSSFNLQPWRVVAVRDGEKKKRVRQCAFDQPKVEEASVVLIMVADPKGVEQNLNRVLDSWQQLGFMQAEARETYAGIARDLYGSEESLQRRLFAVKNTALFAMNLMIAAKGLGLETHSMDGFDEGCIKKEFGIPDDKIIPMLIALGSLKPETKLLPRAFRRELSEFVTYDRY